jgi:hypothetical protein
MGVDFMRPAFNLEPKYRITMLTREDWNQGSGTPAVMGGLWQSVRRRLTFLLGRCFTVFQAEIYAILAFVHEIQLKNRPEKYVSALIVKRL